jgi:hypothetical protein
MCLPEQGRANDNQTQESHHTPACLDHPIEVQLLLQGAHSSGGNPKGFEQGGVCALVQLLEIIRRGKRDCGFRAPQKFVVVQHFVVPDNPVPEAEQRQSHPQPKTGAAQYLHAEAA